MAKLMLNLPKVSIILVNYNGIKHLPTCLNSLKELDYPKEKVEVVVVDNDSTDGSVELLAKDFPEVKVVSNKENKGFAPAVNQGAKVATGSHIALLNNDMKVEKDWLTELAKPLISDSELACTGSKVLDWEGKKIDFVLGMMNFEGRGFQIDFEKPLRKNEYNEPRYMLFVNGGSMLVNRDVFLKVGGFDEDYFAFYEDVDFGWRLWLAGYKVLFVPTSVAYHRHHGTSSKIGQEKLQLLYERNALATIYKNYSDQVLEKVLPAVLLLLNKRAALCLKEKVDDYRIGSEATGEKTDVPKLGVSYILAVEDFIRQLPGLKEKRKKVQALRKRSDTSLFKLFGEIFFSIFQGEEYQNAQIDIQHALGIYDIFLKPKATKVMILTNEVVAEKMAGPGIRCFEIANVLSKDFEVTLAVPNEDPMQHPMFTVKQYQWAKDVKEMAEEHDVIICQGMTLAASPYLIDIDKPLVVDIYDPFVLSLLEQHKQLDIDRRFTECDLALRAHRFQLERGDFFVCASEKQKDFWIGNLSALGRINPQTYDSDVSLKSLIDVVPFGIPSAEPTQTRKAIKGTVPGIGMSDKVILWGGGVYNWFDPLSLIKAMELIGSKRTDIKLYFMGVKHPNPNVPEMEMCLRAVELAKELGLYDQTVFFNFGWVEYADRANFLLDADIGISTHFNHIETRFSFRTRILDYIWANLPVISTQGDAISDLIEQKTLGITVKEDDPSSIAEAIITLLEDQKLYQKCKDNLIEVACEYSWEKAVAPLIPFCANPMIAPDKFGQYSPKLLASYNPAPMAAVTNSSKRHYIRKLRDVYSSYGFKETVRRGARFVKNRI
ncbi:MAG: glycosyltransferase [Actinobacteria bacterium]|nr:MAG: glycosyltransferase [Actinomycetota bacterium]